MIDALLVAGSSAQLLSIDSTFAHVVRAFIPYGTLAFGQVPTFSWNYRSHACAPAEARDEPTCKTAPLLHECGLS